MSKPTSAVKNRYNAKTYDRITIVVPKGRKAAVEAFAQEKGISVNGFITDLLIGALGISQDEWKNASFPEKEKP